MKLVLGPRQACSPPPTHQHVETIGRPNSKPATVKLGKRWAEYQGANNWDGLLDPFDDTLRSEILRYGEFVQAAYTSFDSDPSSPTYTTCRFPKQSLLPRSGLPSTGYRVTRNLHATSGLCVPRWVDDIGRPAWLSRQSSWIGYVAVCQDREEIGRLGRRDIVIAYRGTATGLEWLENLRATQTRLPCAAMPGSDPVPMVESGFWSLFTSPGSSYCSLRDEVRDEVGRLLHRFGGKPLSITVTGHSLGAALAVLTSYDITSRFRDVQPMVTVVSFGGPRVGNASFRRRLEERGSKVLRIVNTQDIVTKIPGFVVGGEVVEDEGAGVIPSWLLSKTGWVYADIGRELRISSSSGSRRRITANFAACHDLKVYLQLVKQLSARCPFRSEARV